jgi:hypothetical protein
VTLSTLKVKRSKLKRYIKQQGGYDLSDIGGEVVLSFVPSFPEALEKGDSDSPPRVIMHGKQDGDLITFFRVQIEDEQGLHTKRIGDAELAYKSWLEFIEGNY